VGGLLSFFYRYFLALHVRRGTSNCALLDMHFFFPLLSLSCVFLLVFFSFVACITIGWFTFVLSFTRDSIVNYRSAGRWFFRNFPYLSLLSVFWIYLYDPFLFV
jgi:hypothetical protein